jgi:hypothetical protein
MTLDEAIFDLHHQGLPHPTAISVLFLYEKTADCYRKGDNFDFKFNELLKIQHTIGYMYPRSSVNTD